MHTIQDMRHTSLIHLHSLLYTGRNHYNTHLKSAIQRLSFSSLILLHPKCHLEHHLPLVRDFNPVSTHQLHLRLGNASRTKTHLEDQRLSDLGIQTLRIGLHPCPIYQHRRQLKIHRSRPQAPSSLWYLILRASGLHSLHVYPTEGEEEHEDCLRRLVLCKAGQSEAEAPCRHQPR